MKYGRIIFIALFALISFACSGFNSQAPQTKTEQRLTAKLVEKLDSLAATFKSLDAFTILEKDSKGGIKLSDKEKKVKPNYLLNPSIAEELTTLQQKYYGMAMLLCDAQVALRYDMPVNDYKEYIAKLAISANIDNIPDPLDIHAINTNMDTRQATLYWSYCAAFCVEFTYILTQNIEKFIVFFDDKSAAQVSKRLNLVEDAVSALMPYEPAMRELNHILEPLYILDVNNVAQLTDQLYQLKNQISTARERMLE